MADYFIILISTDPEFQPDTARQTAAVNRLRELAPQADDIRSKLTERIQFFDCGANFERVVCPSCGAWLDAGWWTDRMDEDFHEGGFSLQKYPTPCCRMELTLADLDYEWPQGFARFAVEVMNAGMGELPPGLAEELARIIGTSVRIIHRRL